MRHHPKVGYVKTIPDTQSSVEIRGTTFTVYDLETGLGVFRLLRRNDALVGAFRRGEAHLLSQLLGGNRRLVTVDEFTQAERLITRT